ncbi:MAG: hypothetical protein H0V31_09630, partial [Acidobacteria bacterium]|nr:hypothetical protein [Acidobacteriota bacterium]
MNTLLLADLANPNADISAVLPEMILAIAGTLVMLYDSFAPKQRYVTGAISLIGLALSAVFLYLMWGNA